jgi:hypothetical protein
VEVRTSRVKAAVVAVGCAALAAVLAVAAQSAGLAWVGVGLFALGVIASGKRVLLPTTVLRLDDRQLIIAGGLRGRPNVPWSQVRSVEVRHRGLRGSVVALSIQDGQGSRRLEFSDTWLDTSADLVAREIVARANAPRLTQRRRGRPR